MRVAVDKTVKVLAVSFIEHYVLFPDFTLTRCVSHQVTFALELTYNFCQLAIKASLLFLYKTVLTLENRRFRIAWYAVAFCVITLYTASILATVFQCIPTSYGWERLYAKMEGHCVNRKAEAITTAVLSTLSDMSLLILPIPIVWGLQMPLKRKLGLLGIFLLGGLYALWFVLRP